MACSFGQSPSNVIETISFEEKVLDADWEFYWNALFEPENFQSKPTHKIVTLDNWTNYSYLNLEELPPFGYATYRTKFSIPAERPHVSIYVPSIYASCNIWINGKLVSTIGQVGTTKETTFHRRTSQIIPLDTKETDFEVIIQVANFYHHKGGIDKPLIVNTTQILHAKRSKRIIADMFFIGSLSFIGIFFLLFFLLYWNKDRAVLFFAILCLSLSYMALSDRYAPLAEAFETISWILLTKVEYISLFLSGVSASLFFYTIFIKFVPKIYKTISLYVFYALVALVVVLPSPYFTQFVLPFLL
jgi:hypothetical protein